MIDPFETPRQRRERYLSAAAGAREIAVQAPNESVRERDLKLAKLWLILASEIPLVQEYIKAMVRQIGRLRSVTR